MYKVYCDNHLLYSPDLENYIIINPKVDIELNKTGSFTFSIYPTHPNFNRLQKLKSIITVYRVGSNEPLFRGRILDDVQGFYNEKQVTCEGELAFLLDSIQRPYNFQNGTSVDALFTYYIEQHNLQVDNAHEFTVGDITVTGNIIAEDSTYMNTWDSINKKLIESFGGYLRIRHENNTVYIDYLADLNTLSNQTIEFGKNLLELKKTIKGTDIGTAVIPLGAKLTDAEGKETDERLTIKSVNGGSDYIFDQQAVDKYGYIFKTIIYDDITDPSILLSEGRKYLSEIINLSVSIELSAVDLSALNTDISNFNLGTNIHIKSKPHNLDTNMLVTKLSIDLLNPQSNKLTLGKTYNTFTEQTQNTVESINNINVKASSNVSASDVGNMIISNCYTKSQIDNNTMRRIQISNSNGTDVINIVKNQLDVERDFFNIAIYNANYSYFGLLFTNDGILNKLSGNLTCTADSQGNISISVPGNYNFIFYM